MEQNIYKRVEYLTVTEVMDLLMVNRNTVTKYVKHGYFPGAIKLDPFRPNSPIRIPRAEVESFLQKRLLK